jgi:hypothetical protein
MNKFLQVSAWQRPPPSAFWHVACVLCRLVIAGHQISAIWNLRDLGSRPKYLQITWLVWECKYTNKGPFTTFIRLSYATNCRYSSSNMTWNCWKEISAWSLSEWENHTRIFFSWNACATVKKDVINHITQHQPCVICFRIGKMRTMFCQPTPISSEFDSLFHHFTIGMKKSIEPAICVYKLRGETNIPESDRKDGMMNSSRFPKGPSSQTPVV